MFISHNQIHGDFLSILSETNEAYAQGNLEKVREGSYLRVNFENAFYVINKKEEFHYLSAFETEGGFNIYINENVVPTLQVGDEITLSIKEFEIDIVAGLSDAGKKYKIGDVLVVEGGYASMDVTTGAIARTRIVVKDVKEDGSISKIGIDTRGRYLTPPPTEVIPVGGSGVGAKFELIYKPLNQITSYKTSILSIDSKGDGSLLKIGMPFPTQSIKGNISCKKWKLYLNTKYVGINNLGVRYSISSDWSPYLHIPLMVPNSFTVDVVYNQAILKLEQEILRLHQRIDELTSREKQSHTEDLPVSVAQ